MYRNRLAIVVSVAGLAAALAITGCASATASATRTAAGSGTSTARAAQAPADSQAHIMVYSINSDGPDFRAILTGAVGDYGPAVTVHPDGTVDPEHTSELELQLTHGSFRLSIAGLDTKIADAYRHWPSNPGTCSGSISLTAAFPVVAGSGTGSYRGISGSFTVTVTIDEVDVKPVCNGTSKFLSQVILVAGSGTVSF
jgi:hypothetical protein